jgi:hypothetical protein
MTMREAIRPPVIKDPIIQVRILAPIYVGGTAREVGSKAFMASSDATLLKQHVPPSVEII